MTDFLVIMDNMKKEFETRFQSLEKHRELLEFLVEPEKSSGNFDEQYFSLFHSGLDNIEMELVELKS